MLLWAPWTLDLAQLCTLRVDTTEATATGLVQHASVDQRYTPFLIEITIPIGQGNRAH